MSNKLEKKVFTELLDNIYGTITGQCDWLTVVNQISKAVPHSAVALHGYEPELEYVLMTMSDDWDQQYVNAYSDYFYKLSPWIEDHLSRNVGEVYTANELEPDLPGKHKEFYNEWAKPAGVGAGVAVKLLDGPQNYSALTLDYDFDKSEEYDQSTLKFVNAVAPHIQRAITINRNLYLSSNKNSDLKQSLDNLSSPTFILNSSCVVEWMNHAAIQAERVCRGFSVGTTGKLELEKQADNDKLTRLVKEVGTRGIQTPSQPFGTFPIHVSSEPAAPNVVSVSPLSGSISNDDDHMARFFNLGWRVLVCIRYRADQPVIPDEQLKVIFGFTTAEVRVVQALIEDMSVSEIADHLNISQHTVRNHLKRALDKSDCRKQSELVGLILKLVGIGK